MKYKFLFSIVCFVFLFCPFCVFGSEINDKDFFSWEESIKRVLISEKVCDMQINDYYMPRELLKKYMDNPHYKIVSGGIFDIWGNFLDISIMYSDEIDYFIRKPWSNSKYNFSDCAKKLNISI